jgi:hypothetical protein
MSWPPPPREWPRSEPIHIPEPTAEQLARQREAAEQIDAIVREAAERWHAERDGLLLDCFTHLGIGLAEAAKLSNQGRLAHIIRPSGVADDLIIPELGQLDARETIPSNSLVLIRHHPLPASVELMAYGPLLIQWPDGKPEADLLARGW